jgi:BEN domain
LSGDNCFEEIVERESIKPKLITVISFEFSFQAMSQKSYFFFKFDGSYLFPNGIVFTTAQMTQLELFFTESSEKADGKLTSFLLDTVFDKETLLTSTMSGISRINGVTASRLDISKLSFIKELYSQRLAKVESDVQKRKKRLQQFKKQVTQKINNVKKAQKCGCTKK